MTCNLKLGTYLYTKVSDGRGPAVFPHKLPSVLLPLATLVPPILVLQHTKATAVVVQPFPLVSHPSTRLKSSVTTSFVVLPFTPINLLRVKVTTVTYSAFQFPFFWHYDMPMHHNLILAHVISVLDYFLSDRPWSVIINRSASALSDLYTTNKVMKNDQKLIYFTWNNR